MRPKRYPYRQKEPTVLTIDSVNKQLVAEKTISLIEIVKLFSANFSSLSVKN